MIKLQIIKENLANLGLLNISLYYLNLYPVPEFSKFGVVELAYIKYLNLYNQINTYVKSV
jgi:hypothetical protein